MDALSSLSCCGAERNRMFATHALIADELVERGRGRATAIFPSLGALLLLDMAFALLTCYGG